MMPWLMRRRGEGQGLGRALGAPASPASAQRRAACGGGVLTRPACGPTGRCCRRGAATATPAACRSSRCTSTLGSSARATCGSACARRRWGRHGVAGWRPRAAALRTRLCRGAAPSRPHAPEPCPCRLRPSALPPSQPSYRAGAQGAAPLFASHIVLLELLPGHQPAAVTCASTAMLAHSPPLPRAGAGAVQDVLQAPGLA
jgi:hypothetical protein